MMKNLLAVALMAAAGSAMAAGTADDPIPYGAGDTTTRGSLALNYIYTVSDTARADRLFVKNDFNFTLSSNVIMTADEDADGRYMVVGTGNAQGRNVFIGHSNGGSVTSCDDPLTAEEAKVEGAIATALGARFGLNEPNGCTEQ